MLSSDRKFEFSQIEIVRTGSKQSTASDDPVSGILTADQESLFVIANEEPTNVKIEFDGKEYVVIDSYMDENDDTYYEFETMDGLLHCVVSDDGLNEVLDSMGNTVGQGKIITASKSIQATNTAISPDFKVWLEALDSDSGFDGITEPEFNGLEPLIQKELIDQFQTETGKLAKRYGKKIEAADRFESVVKRTYDNCKQAIQELDQLHPLADEEENISQAIKCLNEATGYLNGAISDYMSKSID